DHLGKLDCQNEEVRLFGSIHERLLGWDLCEDGDGLHLLRAGGERKARGAYYTPAAVVSYLVPETLGPVVEGKLAALWDGDAQADLADRLFDCRVLDPAMGSGHFLVEAGTFLTERLVRFLRELPPDVAGATRERLRDQLCAARTVAD